MKTPKKYRKRVMEDHDLKLLYQISSYFRETRIMTGLSRADFSKQNGISRSLLDRAESGKHNITLSTVFHLCNLYEISFSELVEQDTY